MKWFRLVLGLALVAGVGAIAAQGVRKRPAPAVEVQLSKAHTASISRIIAGAGKMQAATQVKISSNLTGDLTELFVKEGDRVTRGQVLCRIDRRRFEAVLRQANAARNGAQADIQLAQVEVDRTLAEQKRVEGLVAKGVSSPAELERAKADEQAAEARLASAKQRFDQAGATLDDARNNMAHTTLTSPIDGTVISLTREVGERVRGSDFNEDVVMIIAALSAMEVKIEVGEHEVVFLKPGQKAEVAVDAFDGQSFVGTVTEIAQQATIKNPGTEAEVTSFPVTVALDARPPGALPGMSAEVRINAETHPQAITIPVQAVTTRPEKSLPDAEASKSETALTVKKRGEALAKVVFVVDAQNKAHPRRVKTGIASETEIEITEGLSDGEKIVEGSFRTLSKDLKDGDTVEETEPGKEKRTKGLGKS